jgi:hypothetical protein
MKQNPSFCFITHPATRQSNFKLEFPLHYSAIRLPRFGLASQSEVSLVKGLDQQDLEAMASESYPWDNFREPRDLDRNLCFLLTPFHPDFAGTKQMIEDVARELHLRCERADDIQYAGTIHADIWSRIQQAAVIVADLTTLNPNVMFELGVATAVKEQFRVVLVVRRDEANKVPFDLRPFRHIQYEDSMAGARSFRSQLREYLRLAISDDAMFSSLRARMEEWVKSDHSYGLLVQPETLARAKAASGVMQIDTDLRAYLLAASIQHGCDLIWWMKHNSDNTAAAHVIAELLFGPWTRPQFRAAFALQNLEQSLKNQTIAEIRSLNEFPLVKRLVDAAEQGRVVEVTSEESSGLITEAERYELLRNFVPRARLKLSVN